MSDSTAKVWDAARHYAKRGWRVLPLDGKVPMPGSRGYKDATTDPDTIAKWETKYPNANIGVTTGVGSRVVVIDVDGEEGEEGVRELGLDQVETLRTVTGRGRHIWLRTDQAVPTKLSFRPKLDIKGEGGYVVVPPSIHPETGNAYVWEDRELDLAPVPALLKELLAAPPVESQSADRDLPG